MQPRAIFKVVVNGVDYTDRFDPVLQSITVTDQDGTRSDSAQIVVADVDGEIYLPEKDADVDISLGHEGSGAQVVFRGKVDSVRSRGDKRSGRSLAISAKGLDQNSRAKEPTERHADNQTFGQVAQRWGRAAGLSAVRVSQSLSSQQRPYWAMQNESFLHWAERTAGELGATFRISGNEGIFVDRNEAKSASGKSLPTIRAVWGENLIDWDVDPYSGREQYQASRSRWYDRRRARHEEESEDVGDTTSRARRRTRHNSGTQGGARQNARSGRTRSRRDRGGGHVTLLGTPAARPECLLVIEGAREGVDGEHKIRSITHTYTKKAGYTTKVSIGRPEGGAGRDGRRSRRRRRRSR